MIILETKIFIGNDRISISSWWKGYAFEYWKLIPDDFDYLEENLTVLQEYYSGKGWQDFLFEWPRDFFRHSSIQNADDIDTTTTIQQSDRGHLDFSLKCCYEYIFVIWNRKISHSLKPYGTFSFRLFFLFDHHSYLFHNLDFDQDS